MAIPLTEATRKQRAYNGAVNKSVRVANRLDDAAIRKVYLLLKQARANLNAAILDATGWDATYLPRLRNEVNRIFADFQTKHKADFERLQLEVENAATQLVKDPLMRIGYDVGTPMLPSDLTTVMADFHAGQIKGLADEAIAKITTELQLGILSGAKKEDVLKGIAKLLPSPAGAGTITGRATRIVRTEVNRFHAMVTQVRMEQAQKQVPGLKKYWLTAGDERVRDTHVQAGIDYGPENAIPIDEPFMVGGYAAMYPRDPALPVGEVVNCRCRQVPVVPEVE